MSALLPVLTGSACSGAPASGGRAEQPSARRHPETHVVGVVSLEGRELLLRVRPEPVREVVTRPVTGEVVTRPRPGWVVDRGSVTEFLALTLVILILIAAWVVAP